MNFLLGTVNIGIFSRDDKSSYQWLTSHLSPHRCVQTVESVQVSNDSGVRLTEGVRRCTFAILYHTKKRGRINITDVTDSLYDEELYLLSSEKGKENVIVVVDDLEDDGNNGHKDRILRNQPSIQRLAIEVFCFTLEEKMTLTDKCPVPKIMAKLRQIEKMIEERAGRKNQPLKFSHTKAIFIFTAAVLGVYAGAVYWYNRSVLMW
ncbi:uncharacterized protein [Phyllobates terribilis]|uniref:uncharacterized protein n=1 Tax=Phyllobates terribilis TaxID=111132 RepID=UPI003CCAC990